MFVIYSGISVLYCKFPTACASQRILTTGRLFAFGEDVV